ncbi:MAG TPA: PAS domain-containing protein [Alphaproteobacteria bacterium]|nr:PAS domain-containing protein [Alphaproteobacteria bacterium]
MELEIEQPSLRQLYAYWDQKRRGRRFPARADIDPLELGFVLGNLSLIDVLHEPLRFRFRLQGTMAVSRLGYDLTGKLVDEIPDPEYRQITLATYRTIVEQGQPMRAVREQMYDHKIHRYEIVWLPLANNGESINMLVACVALF